MKFKASYLSVMIKLVGDILGLERWLLRCYNADSIGLACSRMLLITVLSVLGANKWNEFQEET